MNCVYLSLTTLFFLFPVFVFLTNKRQNIYESVLATLLTINIILSLLFWTYPIENSMFHIYDGIFGKISYIFFSIYILFIKPIKYKLKMLSLVILLFVSVVFYYSNHYSRMNWCSKAHLGWHSIFHFLCSFGCSLAFI